MANKKYRVLRDVTIHGVDVKPDNVVSIDEKLGATYKAAGALDDTPASVAYVEKDLERKAITLEAPKAAEPEAEKAKA
jgi:hypothetical protein